MGCTPESGKLRQHRTVGLEIDASKCTGCGKCKAACALQIPDIIEGKAHNTSTKCMRCPMCIDACPMDAISFVEKENLSKALASAAYGVISTFKPGRVSFVSFARYITKYCDCLPNPGENMIKDIGILAGDSAVSVDGAFLELADYKVLNDSAHIDCMLQVKEAKRLGLKGDVKPKINAII